MTKLNFSYYPQAIFLMGPTASSKTTLAIALRQYLPVEIISVDSALIYRYMDIGTAKPSIKELSLAPHRLINICDPSETYSVAYFYRDALQAMTEITKSGRIPLLVGGTMLYFKVLLEGLSPLPPANPKIRAQIKQEAEKVGYQSLHRQLQHIDPIAAQRISPRDLIRLSRALEVFYVSGHTLTELTKISGKALKYQVYKFAIAPINRELLNQRNMQRFNNMLISGFEHEVSKLFARGDLHQEMSSIRCIGYRQMWAYLTNQINYNEMVFRTIHATRQLAKHQMTWLRKWHDIYWLDSEKITIALDKMLRIINVQNK